MANTVTLQIFRVLKPEALKRVRGRRKDFWHKLNKSRDRVCVAHFGLFVYGKRTRLPATRQVKLQGLSANAEFGLSDPQNEGSPVHGGVRQPVAGYEGLVHAA